jgi:phosphate transport system permease protein
MSQFAIDHRLVRRRKRRNIVALTLCSLAAIVGVVFLFWILAVLLIRGGGAMSTDLFLLSEPVTGAPGGFAHAIVGSIMMVSVAMLIAVPVGILAGTYLAEYGRGSVLASVVRFINDILLSAPSILIGLFVYAILVKPLGGYSGWAGAVALAIIAIPVILRTTEDMLLLVPQQLREAGAALGAPSGVVIRSIVWRGARAGIVTGAVLAMARIFGETAPLILTALNNLYMSFDMSAPLGNLPVSILQAATTPYEDLQALAWAGSFLMAAIILALSILARFLFSDKRESRS